MGACSSKEQLNNNGLDTFSQQQPVKCILLQQPHSLILELSNSSIKTIKLLDIPNNFQLGDRISSNLYLGPRNEVYYITQTDSLQDKRFMEIAYAYYLMVTNKGNGFVEPIGAYLVRENIKGKKGQGKYTFIVQSVELGEGKYVELRDLGKKMRQKSVCWQDLEFGEIITMFCRKYSQIVNRGFDGMSHIIIGSNGSIHLLGVSTRNAFSLPDVKNLQDFFFQSLYGLESTEAYWDTSKLQQTSPFKHPESLRKIEKLGSLIRSELLNKYELISNPSLKFIKDYIVLYYYKLNRYNKQSVDILLDVGMHNSAKQILQQFVGAGSMYKGVDDQIFYVYQKLYDIQMKINGKSRESGEAMLRVGSAGIELGDKYKGMNEYKKSYYFYKKCLLVGVQSEAFYMSLAQICQGLSLYEQTGLVYIEGLKWHPESRILNLFYIVYLCDCFDLQEAEKILLKSTSYLRTLQLQICSGKIMLGKGVLGQGKGRGKEENAFKCRELLGNVVLEKYFRETNNKNGFAVAAISVYHEVLGDSYFYQKVYDQAIQEYHTSKILIKNGGSLGYRIGSITAAEANCYMMKCQYDVAIKLYDEAVGYVGVDCKNLRDSILGNRAICKIRGGIGRQEGRKEIEKILETISKETLENDYNYMFLANVLKGIIDK